MSGCQNLIMIASHFQRFLSNNIASDENICRLCLQTGKNCNFISVDFGQPSIKSKLTALIPELNLDIIESPVICGPCSTSLDTAFQLKLQSLCTEEKILSKIYNSVPVRPIVTPIRLACLFPEYNQTMFNGISDSSSSSHSGHTMHHKKSLKASEFILEQPQIGTTRTNINCSSTLRPYSCDICMKSFSIKGNLDIHKRTHTKDRPFQCNVCHKRFSTKGNLKTHSRVHTKERPYICHLCDKTFIQKVQLNTHLQLHEDKQSFACDVCSKSYSSKGTLQIHKRIHDNYKPYGCKFCEKTFTTNGNLMVHMRKHTGETPYQCSECPKAFTQQNQLKTHMNFHRRCIFDDTMSIE